MSMYKTIYYTEDDTYSAGDQIIGINGEIKRNLSACCPATVHGLFHHLDSREWKRLVNPGNTVVSGTIIASDLIMGMWLWL